ncbi:hypothetical protein FPOA_27856 [Fusarium poae]|uniref:DUF659 domain-containing protein n=1 Tax=Fusarium poae TaxID=36050 RepID=A0A1B8A6D0_FUSPO|nr:hypothetical protein FPOA_27856 [Fusarium poae]
MDAWTSEEGTNYLAVVAHFLDERHNLQTALLGIRWISVYFMIERALKLRHAIDLFFLNYRHIGAEGYDISQDILTAQDWVDLDHFLNILKPFKDLTKRMEGRANRAGSEGSHGSLHEIIESLDVLFKKF